MNEVINIVDITIGKRLRTNPQDFEDLSDLDSIETVGLIQPIVVQLDANGKPLLMAGERRLTRVKQLGFTKLHHAISCDKTKPGFVFVNELPEDVRREIELYENLGRTQMGWIDRVKSIAEIHKLKKHRAALDAETWGQAETGAEIGQSYGMVSYILAIAEEMDRPGTKVFECKGVTEAIRYLAELRTDKAKRQLAELTSKTIAPQITVEAAQIEPTEPGTVPPLVVPLSKMLLHKPMEQCSLVNEVDHIVTDWPYAIDMDYLDQGQGMDVSRVRAEHDVKSNLANYPLWMSTMFTALKPGGFCVIWYDNVNWQLIRDLAERVGFRVQRWPLVWVKTSPCLNQMASKNWTKATEFAIVLTKGNAILQKTQSTNYWSGPRASTTSNPFAKPKGLWQWIYSAICLQGDVVLDPFAGEGSATLAAIDFGLRPLASESNEDHFNQLTMNVRAVYDSLTKGNIQFT